jgi:hypothetical protein
MTLTRIISVITGVVAFGVAHLIIISETFRAALTPDPSMLPWYTNGSRTVALTVGIAAMAALIVGLFGTDRRDAMRRGLGVGVGAMAGMLAVMFRVPIGNLAPIVFAIGGLMLLAAGLAGGSVAALFKGAARR